MPWSQPFSDPIKPPKGRELVTLKDAADYILKLPKKAHDTPEWQNAGKMLIEVAEGRLPLMMAEIALRRALSVPAGPVRKAPSKAR